MARPFKRVRVFQANGCPMGRNSGRVHATEPTESCVQKPIHARGVQGLTEEPPPRYLYLRIDRGNSLTFDTKCGLDSSFDSAPAFSNFLPTNMSLKHLI